MKFGILMFDLGGGDNAFHFVDEERWDQIKAAQHAIVHAERGWKDKFVDLTRWLTSDNSPETCHPEGAPDRKGKLLASYFCQSYVLETSDGILPVQGELLGILTL
jgi:hypothetical protein